MADSVGGSGFPRTGIQEGHLHFDRVNNILYIWNGGNPVLASSWSQVGGSGSLSGGFQRWPYKLIGTELSTGFGSSGLVVFFVPAAGVISKWGIIASLGAEVAIMELQSTITGAIDNITIPGGTLGGVFERVQSKTVVVGEQILVLHTNTLNPAAHSVKINGYVDFTPS